MTLLQVMSAEDAETVVLRTRDEAEITRALEPQGVAFQRWPLRIQVTSDVDSDALLGAYEAEVDELCAQQGLRLVDVARIHVEDTPQWQEKADKARSTFLEEHRHAEDEVRFFAHGTGCFYLHLDGQVFAVVCEAGDLLSVPAGTPHWFDMGPRPEFAAIRFFEKEDGWVGDFTGEPIAQHFPRLDALLADNR
ncbi:acireductone dioxygenase [Streptomyces sp. RKAG293]|uniref:1,2-dihydroxy-3-keto-5-methylthiopentene dioxygenase n=1 Tax=Streptomyces sp. RKAG293 TaxID=2893403 RepID=UPI0020336E11|nr:cupin domain-containing protein [Streptomyces sp. RKAG293]MCM2416753.1 cupin domain-containing protein [Streptomyces sp. RKAG293]